MSGSENPAASPISPAIRWAARIGIEPREAKLVFWGAACLSLLGWADVSVQNVSETFFLKRVGVAYLPLAFLVSSTLLVATTYAVGRFASHRDRPRLLWRVFLFVSVAMLPLWLLVHLELPGAVVLLILSAKQIEALVLIVFWVAMGDLLQPRQAKRLYAPLMSGLTLGTITGSFASAPIGKLLGVDGLLYFSSIVLALGAVCALPLGTMRPIRIERGLRDTARRVAGFPSDLPLTAISKQGSLISLWRNSELFRLLLLATLCAGILGPMLYFQFSYVADLATAGRKGEQKLLSLYAQFRGWINLAVLAAQLTLTSRVYRRLSVPLAAALSPTIYILGFFGLSVRLNLTGGIIAVAAARLQDESIGDPAMRVLFNLFPDATRARAAALLDPIKRAGGALGNVAVLIALALGSALWVGYLALPIAAFWLVVAVFLWRAYPNLLLAAAAGKVKWADDQAAELVNPRTVPFLAAQLLDPDPTRCRAAIELLSDARPELSVRAMARAAVSAPGGNRPLIVHALNDLVERRAASSLRDEEAAGHLSELLTEREKLGDRERAAAVRAFGRLAGELHNGAAHVLDHALADPVPAVRLAALAALHRRGQAPGDAPDVDESLAAAVHSNDVLSRRVAGEELRAFLLSSPTEARWEDRLGLLAELLARPLDRLAAAEAIDDVARRYGGRARPAERPMLGLKSDPDAGVRAAVLRFAGHAGLEEQAPWLVEHIGSRDEREAAAAREGLLALGPRAVNAMMVEHSFGKRSTRNAILSIVREFEVDKETLRQLYHRELESLRRKVVTLGALRGGTASPIVLQRLEERLSEGLHTAMLFLTAIHDEDRIAELDELLRRTRSERQHAILLEALEVFLTPDEKAELLPLLEESSLETRARAAASALGIALPSFEETTRLLLQDSDEITRSFALATAAPGLDEAAPNGDDPKAMSPVEIALQIKANPIFERLSARQLMDLARLVREESYDSGAAIFREDDQGSCMYLIVDGEVGILKGEEEIARLGERDFFGELALFEGVQRTATVVARSAVRLLRLERHDLLSLIEELPAIAIGICESLSRRVRDTSNRAVAR